MSLFDLRKRRGGPLLRALGVLAPRLRGSALGGLLLL